MDYWYWYNGLARHGDARGNAKIHSITKAGWCIGINTLLNTSKGIIPLKELKVGDKVMGWNRKTNQKYMETVYYIREHGNNKILHYRITAKNNNNYDIMNLTQEHLVLLSDKTYKRADQLTINDKLLNINDISIIKNIEKVTDIPLTPVILSGKIVLPNNTIISCWSHNTKNANLMDKILGEMAPYTKVYPPEKVSEIFDKAYSYFVKENKKIKVKDVLKKLNIPIPTN